MCNNFPGIPSDFTEVSSHPGKFIALYTTKLDWNAATLYCTSLHENAHLVTITSDREQQAVNDYMKGRYSFSLWDDFADQSQHTVNSAIHLYRFSKWAAEHAERGLTCGRLESTLTLWRRAAEVIAPFWFLLFQLCGVGRVAVKNCFKLLRFFYICTSSTISVL